MKPEILLGPPGTGKTTNLIDIVRQEMAAGTDPRRIGYVAFTVRAAEEARDRARNELGLSRADLPHFGTLHSVAKRWAGISSKDVMSGAKIKEFAEWIGEPIAGKFNDDGSFAGYERGDRMMFMDNLARVRGTPLRTVFEEAHDDLEWPAVERFSAGLRSYKAEHGLYDFTDMLQEFVEGGNGPDLDVLIGDEVQDFSWLQYEAFQSLGADARRIVVAGDDDQGIFAWSGADPGILTNMEGDARVLDQSYRVPIQVQKVASRIIARVRNRRPKEWLPRAEDGEVRHLTHWTEAPLDGDSVMILSRNRRPLQEIEKQLHMMGVFYRGPNGNPSVSRKLIDAVVTWERLRRGEPQFAADVLRVYEHMSSGIGVERGHKTLPGIPPDRPMRMDELRSEGGLMRDDAWHLALDRVPVAAREYLIRCRRRGERLMQEPRVRVSTIHGSKGGEAGRVILLTDMEPRTWREMRADPESEARVFYVAVTRARNELMIVQPSTRLSYNIP